MDLTWSIVGIDDRAKSSTDRSVGFQSEFATSGLISDTELPASAEFPALSRLEVSVELRAAVELSAAVEPSAAVDRVASVEQSVAWRALLLRLCCKVPTCM